MMMWLMIKNGFSSQSNETVTAVTLGIADLIWLHFVQDFIMSASNNLKR
jgi:hypothetical protein